MPIKVSKDLPAIKELAKENIFVMDELRAVTQDIRPLKIIIVNLMPTKQATETQFIRLLSNTCFGRILGLFLQDFFGYQRSIF